MSAVLNETLTAIPLPPVLEAARSAAQAAGLP